MSLVSLDEALFNLGLHQPKNRQDETLFNLGLHQPEDDWICAHHTNHKNCILCSDIECDADPDDSKSRDASEGLYGIVIPRSALRGLLFNSRKKFYADVWCGEKIALDDPDFDISLCDVLVDGHLVKATCCEPDYCCILSSGNGSLEKLMRKLLKCGRLKPWHAQEKIFDEWWETHELPAIGILKKMCDCT